MGSGTEAFPVSIPLYRMNQNSSQSIADLPSALKEIFNRKQTLKVENLKSMKPITKSCTDLRRVNSYDPNDDYAKYQYSMDPSGSDINTNTISRANNLMKNYSQDNVYQDLRQPLFVSQEEYCFTNDSRQSNVQNCFSQVFVTENEVGKLKRMQEARKTRPASLSDTSDDECLINRIHVSPTRNARSSWLDDPGRMLKAKLKHTHSLSNLSQHVSDEPRRPLASIYSSLKSKLPPSGCSFQYHTIHAGCNPTTTRLTQSYNYPIFSPPETSPSASAFMRTNNSRKSAFERDDTNEMFDDPLLEEAPEELESNEDLIDHEQNYYANMMKRSDSPFHSPSSGYRTLDATSYQYDTYLLQYLRDKKCWRRKPRFWVC